jgi:hypothetical protein
LLCCHEAVSSFGGSSMIPLRQAAV